MNVSRPIHLKLGASIDRENQARRETGERTRWLSEREAEPTRAVISRASLKDSFPGQTYKRRASYFDSAPKRIDWARNSSGGTSTTLPSRQI